MIEVGFFQQPRFGKKAYLARASEIVMQILEKLTVREDETIEICSSYIFEKALRDLEEKYGKERVVVGKIVNAAQQLVETAYVDEIRNLGYEPIPEREEKRARSFFHMLRWLKRDPCRFRHAKTGWPRLERYLTPRRARRRLHSTTGLARRSHSC
jgi:hypothetical protein